MEDITIITENIFKNDLQQYTFNITYGGERDILDKNIYNILNNKKYKVFKCLIGLLLEYLLIRYAKYNMKQIFKEQPYIDIIHRFTLFDKKKLFEKDNISYNVKSTLTNQLLDNDIIQNKKNLYFEMLKYKPEIANKYFAKTYLLKNVNTIDNVYIIRMFNKYLGYSGKNIYVVESTKQLNEIKKKVNINEFIISEYIKNPLLFKNKKFHLRVAFMIAHINNEITFSIFKHVRIITAKLSYIEDDYLNKDIHDTHYGSTDDNYLFYNEFKNNNNYYNIINQIRLIIKECVDMIKTKIKLYPESKNGYQLYGCDFMITNNYIVKLLEINGSNSGYEYKNINNNNNIQIMFNKDFFGWIFNKTVIPIFYPKLLLFDNNINIRNKYYNIIKDNNILTIKLNVKCNDILIYYIIIINLLCPYKKSSDITLLDLTKNDIWKKTCNIIKCNYIIIDKKYNLIITNNLNHIKDFKKYIIIEDFYEHEFYKGLIKFNDKKFYIYKK